MDTYKTPEGKTLVVIEDIKLAKEDACKVANRYFKVKKENLCYRYGWVKGDTLYYSKQEDAQKVWVIATKGDNLPVKFESLIK